MADLINSIIDINVISKEVETTLLQLGSIDKRMEELSKKAITLHFEVKKDESMSTLLAHMKEYGKMVSEISQKEKEHAAVSAKLAEAESKLAEAANATTNATKQIIFVQDKQKKSVEELNTAMDNASDTYRHWVDGASAVKNSLASNSAALVKAKEDVKDFSKRLSDMSSRASWQPISPEAIRELETKLGNASARVEQYTKAVKENRQELKLAEVVENGVAGSYEVRSAMMGRLLAVAKSLGNETEEEKKHQEDLAIAINTLNDSLKESDEAWGNNQRKVGTYENATKGLRGIIADITNQMAALSLAGQSNSEEYQELSKKASEYNNALRNVQKETRGLASDTASMDALRNSLQALNVAFISLKNAGGFAEDGTLLANVMDNLQKTIGLVSAATEIYNLTNKSSVLISKIRQLQSLALAKSIQLETAATGKATIAQRIFNAVAKANPYVLLAMALVTVVGALVLFSSRTSEAEKRQKELNDAMKEANKSVSGNISNFNAYSKIITSTNVSIAAQTKALDGLNAELQKSGKQFKTVQEAQEWLTKNSEAYISALRKEAEATAYMNLYQKKLEEYYEKLGNTKFQDNSAKVQGQLIELQKEATGYLNLATGAMAEQANAMSKLGLSTGNTANDFNKLKETLDKYSQTEIQKAAQVYNEKLALIQANAKDDAEYQKYQAIAYKEFQDTIAEINRKSADEQKKVIDNIAKLRVDGMGEGKEKELAALRDAQEKEIAAVIGNAKQREEQITLINEIHRKKRDDVDKKYTEAGLKSQADAWQLEIDIAEKGSEQEYKARVGLLEVERKMEVNAAAETGADVEKINTYYDQQTLAAFSDFIEAKVAKAQEEAAARARIAEEAAAVEEAALLEQYKNREINEEQYNKGVADIRHKYSVQALKDEIGELEKLLTTADLTADQRKAIDEKLYDAKKELSDEETEHEIENIKKVEAQRKKAADTAKDLAKQAFDMAMEFLTMQSEAKIEEFDAELERIDEQMEKQLEELDNAVMSDETRAAEEKRIRDKAEADRKKVEEEKRKEQQKQAAYQKTQSIISSIIATAQSIVQTGANLGYPLAIPFQVMAGIIGAAQVALIAAQPLPKYAEGIFGDESHPGGYAIVGDARKREYALTPSGKLYETPAVPTLVDMTKGTQVFPDYQTMMQYFRPEIPKYETNTTAPDLSDGLERLERAIKENKSVQHVSMNLDKNGIWLLSKNGNRKTRYVNSRITQ